MALNPNYIVAPGLQQHFTDKDTGEFLRNGYVLFFRDIARTEGKIVYKLSGTPPNYTYVEYGEFTDDDAWRIDLNDQGAFDEIVYYFPFDEDGNDDLYFIEVFSAENVPQFSREAQPNFAGNNNSGGTVVDLNFVPNGQFLLHNNLPVDGTTYEVNEIRAPITNIAFGGWTFERPMASSARDFVEFERYGSAVTEPDGNPRYSLRVICESASPGDAYKDIRLKYNDVNKFASTVNEYTYAFTAQTNSGSSQQVSLILIKNYGTGGDTQTETFIQNFTITASLETFAATFTFGENTGKVIGADDDDFLQLAIRLPVDGVFDLSFDDFIQTPGSVAQPLFPDTTNSQFTYRSLGGFFPIPDPNGFTLALPVIQTLSGFSFDTSQVGKIYPCIYPVAQFGELLNDGAKYETVGYSADGIPYLRLQSVLWNSTLNVPMFGTGADYFTADLSTLTPASEIRVFTNSTGTVTPASDGSAATGFTFTTIFTAPATAYYTVGKYANGVCYIWNNQVGDTNGITAGDSGFTVTEIRDYPLVRAIFSVQTIAATTLASKYFTFNTINAMANQSYYVWFKVDTIGTDPAPGGTGIQVNLLSTYTAADVAKIIAEAISGYQVTAIVTLAASAITAGDFFNINSSTESYYVWYKKDGVGTDPAVVGKIGIEVDILSADTAAQVATKTQIAMNGKYFATPDFRGVFPRFWNNGSGIDPNAASRWAANGILNGDFIGTFEFDEIYQHGHTIPNSDNSAGAGAFVVNADTNPATGTGLTGGSESRPINAYVNSIIKY